MGKRKGRVLRVGLYALIGLCVVGIAYSGYRVYGIQSEYSKADHFYAGLKAQVAQGNSKVMPTLANALEKQADQQTSPTNTQTTPKALSTQSASKKAQMPPSQMDFTQLKGHNSDTVGWITLADTVIDYPVVQGKDNSYYLDRLFSGESAKAGSIFMDAANAPDFKDKNTILFGHNMKNGSMFASLSKYENQQYYEEHSEMMLYTPGGDYTIEWFAGYPIMPAPIPTVYDDNAAFMDFVNQAKAKSDFKSLVEIAPTDRIITLCTCSYVAEDARYLLVGVLR